MQQKAKSGDGLYKFFIYFVLCLLAITKRRTMDNAVTITELIIYSPIAALFQASTKFCQ